MALSVYVHVPFCRSRCHYCAFYSGEPLSLLPDYSSWVAAEARLKGLSAGAPPGPVTTVYLGGGTPALLAPPAVAAVLHAIDRTWGLAQSAEVSLEANPGSPLDLAGLRIAGVTRLSLGTQCLDDRLLGALGRPHSARQALGALARATGAGFASVSADLLLGLPGVGPADVACWVAALRDAGAQHLSTYSLEIHAGTALAAAVADGSFVLPSPEEEEDQWAAADEALTSRGLVAYEISNYCLPGHGCRHNLAYWEQAPYVGLGPGAHAFDPTAGAWGTRSWNAPDVADYARRVTAGLLPRGDHEALTASQSFLESLFLALRRPVPLDADRLAARHGVPEERFAALLNAAAGAGLLVREGPAPGRAWLPTRDGLRRADALALWLSEAVPNPENCAQTP